MEPSSESAGNRAGSQVPQSTAKNAKDAMKASNTKVETQKVVTIDAHGVDEISSTKIGGSSDTVVEKSAILSDVADADASSSEESSGAPPEEDAPENVQILSKEEIDELQQQKLAEKLRLEEELAMHKKMREERLEKKSPELPDKKIKYASYDPNGSKHRPLLHQVGLVITITDYDYLNSLPLQITRDGHDVVSALSNPLIGGVEPENIIHVKNPTQAEFKKALSDVKKLVKRRKSTFVVYLAAHCGRMGIGNVAYICCKDADGTRANSAKKKSIKVSWFMNKIVGCNARRTLIFFDGWHSGKLQGVTRLQVRRAKRKGNDRYTEKDKATINACAYPIHENLLSHVLFRLARRKQKNRVRFRGKNFPTEAKYNFQVAVLTSCRSTQSSRYGKRSDRNSIFGRHVVASLCGRGSENRRSCMYYPTEVLMHINSKMHPSHDIDVDITQPDPIKVVDDPKKIDITTGQPIFKSLFDVEQIPPQFRGVHTKDIFDHILRELNIISIKLEEEQVKREEEEQSKIFAEEDARLAEKENEYNDVKKQSDDNDKEIERLQGELKEAHDARKNANVKAIEMTKDAGEMAKAASTSEEYQKATDADKAAKKQHEEMQKLQDLEKELTDKLNVKRAMGKDLDRKINRKVLERQDVEREVQGFRRDRKKFRKALARRRKFMLNKPFCQTPFYQCFPGSSQGFFCSHWPEKPDVPKDPKVIESKARSLSLQWNTEAFNGVVIDEYETWIRGKARANSEWRKVRNCDWLPRHLTYFILFHNRTKRIVKTAAANLASETFYQFKTRAHNPGGWTEFSEISEWTRTSSVGYCGETRSFKKSSIPKLLAEVGASENYVGMLKLIESNPYNVELLVGALQYITSSCESFSLKRNTLDGYYDEYGFFHHGITADEKDGDSYEGVINDLLANKCIEIIIERLKYHPKAEVFNRLCMKLLGIFCNFSNVTRRHVVHVGGIDVANTAIETFGGHWKAGAGTAKAAMHAKSLMKSKMTEEEASLIVQKYIRKMKARKSLERLREAKAIEKLAEEDKNYDPIWS